MMKFFFPVLLWLVVASASAQNSPAPTAQAATLAMIAGTVSKDPGSEPIKKALIELIAESQNDGGNYTALTATDGSFRIENIFPGRYRLFVERTGYQEIDKHRHHTESRMLTLTAGQEMKDLIIRLQAAAVIDGRVTDEDGDPMPESQVAVFHQTFVAGRSHLEQAGAERTNDLGEYRIANLPAGNYFVSVTPPPDFKSLIETASATPHSSPDRPAPTAYQTIYYPGTRDHGQAAPIQLHPGDDFPVNFSLAPSPSLTIRGSIVNLPAGSTATISLQSRDFNLVLNGAEMHKDGTFEIRDVSPGAYTIVATVDNAPTPMMARQPLQLTESIDAIRLAPQAGATIRGRLRSETKSTVHVDPSQMFLQLRSADGDDGTSDNLSMGSGFSTLAHVNADGTFTWTDVPAGQYFVQLSDTSALPDWFLKSVAAGGLDVMDAGFKVSGGATALDVVASSKGGSVDGIVINQKDQPVADAMVVAVPEVRLRNRSELYRKASTDQSGHFALHGLPPGSYTIFAWESLEGEGYYSPDFLKNYEGKGKALRVGEAERVAIQIKVIPEVDQEQLQ